MALYNEILVGRYNRGLQKLLSIKGGAPAPQIASEFSASLNIVLDADTDYLFGWDTFGAFTNQAGGVGTSAQIQLHNPATSGIVMVIEKIQVCQLGATDTIRVQLNTAVSNLGTGPFGVQRLDKRTQRKAAAVLSSNAAAAVQANATEIGRMTLLANASMDYILTREQQMPLLPGDGIVLFQTTNNSSFASSWMWKERPLEDSEIT